MKLAISEQTILAKQARLKVKGNKSPSCQAWHSPYRSNLEYAAIEACLQYHDLDFSLAALSNEILRRNNFTGQPLIPHSMTIMFKEKNSLYQHNSNTRSNSQ